MSIMKRDASSGALVFELTPEEKAIQDLTQKVETLTSTVEKLDKKLNSALTEKK